MPLESVASPKGRFRLRAERAATLADRYPASRDALKFFAGVSLFQDSGGTLDELCTLIKRIGPRVLRDAVDRAEELAWFQRVMAEMDPNPSVRDSTAANVCPRCGYPPQLGVLRPHGAKPAFHLACAVCRYEWSFPRTQCPYCSATGEEAVQFAQSDEHPAIQTLTCEQCQRYMHIVDLGADGKAVPEVDEISAQPLDVWATEQGYVKIYPNLIGV